MAEKVLPIKGQAYTLNASVYDASNTNRLLSGAVIVAGDIQISTDEGQNWANFTTNGGVPTVNSEIVSIPLTASEMNADEVLVRIKDQDGPTWVDRTIPLETVSESFAEIAANFDAAEAAAAAQLVILAALSTSLDENDVKLTSALASLATLNESQSLDPEDLEIWIGDDHDGNVRDKISKTVTNTNDLTAATVKSFRVYRNLYDATSTLLFEITNVTITPLGSDLYDFTVNDIPASDTNNLDYDIHSKFSYEMRVTIAGSSAIVLTGRVLPRSHAASHLVTG